MIKKILIVIIVLIAGVLGFAATKADTFTVQRSASIKAPPEKIFAILTDFRRAPEWSPYEKKDPSMKRSFSGSISGKGSIYDFDGNSEVGSGRLEITDATPPSKVELTLDMMKPFKGHNVIDYTLEADGDSTKVTWSMHGAMPYVSKVISVFCDMDKMIGTDFEAGLASLKTLTES